MLVIVKNRDLQALAQLALDIEALRCLDILEVDAAESRLQARDDFHQLVRIPLVDFNVEYVDAGELLEQHRLALHHRLARQRPDRTQAKHRRAVGDDADQVAARRVAARRGRIVDNFLAGRGDTGRIGKRQITLVEQALGGNNRDFSGCRQAVIVERAFAQKLVHGISNSLV